MSKIIPLTTEMAIRQHTKKVLLEKIRDRLRLLSEAPKSAGGARTTKKLTKELQQKMEEYEDLVDKHGEDAVIANFLIVARQDMAPLLDRIDYLLTYPVYDWAIVELYGLVYGLISRDTEDLVYTRAMMSLFGDRNEDLSEFVTNTLSLSDPLNWVSIALLFAPGPGWLAAAGIQGGKQLARKIGQEGIESVIGQMARGSSKAIGRDAAEKQSKSLATKGAKAAAAAEGSSGFLGMGRSAGTLTKDQIIKIRAVLEDFFPEEFTLRQLQQGSRRGIGFIEGFTDDILEAIDIEKWVSDRIARGQTREQISKELGQELAKEVNDCIDKMVEQLVFGLADAQAEAQTKAALKTVLKNDKAFKSAVQQTMELAAKAQIVEADLALGYLERIPRFFRGFFTSAGKRAIRDLTPQQQAIEEAVEEGVGILSQEIKDKVTRAFKSGMQPGPGATQAQKRLAQRAIDNADELYEILLDQDLLDFIKALDLDNLADVDMARLRQLLDSNNAISESLKQILLLAFDPNSPGIGPKATRNALKALLEADDAMVEGYKTTVEPLARQYLKTSVENEIAEKYFRSKVLNQTKRTAVSQSIGAGFSSLKYVAGDAPAGDAFIENEMAEAEQELARINAAKKAEAERIGARFVELTKLPDDPAAAEAFDDDELQALADEADAAYRGGFVGLEGGEEVDDKSFFTLEGFAEDLVQGINYYDNLVKYWGQWGAMGETSRLATYWKTPSWQEELANDIDYVTYGPSLTYKRDLEYMYDKDVSGKSGYTGFSYVSGIRALRDELSALIRKIANNQIRKQGALAGVGDPEFIKSGTHEMDKDTFYEILEGGKNSPLVNFNATNTKRAHKLIEKEAKERRKKGNTTESFVPRTENILIEEKDIRRIIRKNVLQSLKKKRLNEARLLTEALAPDQIEDLNFKVFDVFRELLGGNEIENEINGMYEPSIDNWLRFSSSYFSPQVLDWNDDTYSDGTMDRILLRDASGNEETTSQQSFLGVIVLSLSKAKMQSIAAGGSLSYKDLVFNKGDVEASFRIELGTDTDLGSGLDNPFSGGGIIGCPTFEKGWSRQPSANRPGTFELFFDEDKVPYNEPGGEGVLQSKLMQNWRINKDILLGKVKAKIKALSKKAAETLLDSTKHDKSVVVPFFFIETAKTSTPDPMSNFPGRSTGDQPAGWDTAIRTSKKASEFVISEVPHELKGWRDLDPVEVRNWDVPKIPPYGAAETQQMIALITDDTFFKPAGKMFDALIDAVEKRNTEAFNQLTSDEATGFQESESTAVEPVDPTGGTGPGITSPVADANAKRDKMRKYVRQQAGNGQDVVDAIPSSSTSVNAFAYERGLAYYAYQYDSVERKFKSRCPLFYAGMYTSNHGAGNLVNITLGDTSPDEMIDAQEIVIKHAWKKKKGIFSASAPYRAEIEANHPELLSILNGGDYAAWASSEPDDPGFGNLLSQVPGLEAYDPSYDRGSFRSAARFFMDLANHRTEPSSKGKGGSRKKSRSRGRGTGGSGTGERIPTGDVNLSRTNAPEEASKIVIRGSNRSQLGNYIKGGARALENAMTDNAPLEYAVTNLIRVTVELNFNRSSGDIDDVKVSSMNSAKDLLGTRDSGVVRMWCKKVKLWIRRNIIKENVKAMGGDFWDGDSIFLTIANSSATRRSRSRVDESPRRIKVSRAFAENNSKKTVLSEKQLKEQIKKFVNEFKVSRQSVDLDLVNSIVGKGKKKDLSDLPKLSPNATFHDVNNLKLSQEGFEKLRAMEGVRYEVYDDATGKPIAKYEDAKGHPTIGVGHLVYLNPKATSSGKGGRDERELYKGYLSGVGKMTDSQVDDLFNSDIEKHQTFRSQIHVEITQGMFDALTSYAFNAGAGAPKADGIISAINKKEWESAAKIILNSRTLDGKLSDRRKEEAMTFLSSRGSDVVAENELRDTLRLFINEFKTARQSVDYGIIDTLMGKSKPGGGDDSIEDGIIEGDKFTVKGVSFQSVPSKLGANNAMKLYNIINGAGDKQPGHSSVRDPEMQKQGLEAIKTHIYDKVKPGSGDKYIKRTGTPSESYWSSWFFGAAFNDDPDYHKVRSNGGVGYPAKKAYKEREKVFANPEKYKGKTMYMCFHVKEAPVFPGDAIFHWRAEMAGQPFSAIPGGGPAHMKILGLDGAFYGGNEPHSLGKPGEMKDKTSGSTAGRTTAYKLGPDRRLVHPNKGDYMAVVKKVLVLGVEQPEPQEQNQSNA